MEEIKLTKKELNQAYFTWVFTTELSNSYERLQALSFCTSLLKPLKKLYPDKNEFSQAMLRHLQFYNSEGTFGGAILGIVLSMEEQRANGVEIPEEMITGLKTGLMGPMAGVGDTVVWGTIRPIIFSIAVTLAMSGNILGGLFSFLFSFICLFLGYELFHFGYRVGRTSIQSLLSSGLINKVIQASSILGLIMMGSLSASYVKLSTPLTFTMQNADPFVVQDLLDSIVPGLLPLLVIGGVYLYFDKKGQNYNKVLAAIIVIALIGSFIGVF